MASLLHLLLASFLLADELEKVGFNLPADAFFDCDQLNNENDCISSRWCVWSPSSVNKCQYDYCLKTIDKAAFDADTENTVWCPKDKNNVNCKLYYVKDIHDCNTGDQTDYDGLYCRSDSNSVSKVPIDECFYQDLAAREAGAKAEPPVQANPKCDNKAGLTCKNVTNSPNFNCYQSDKSCSDYFKDVDGKGIPTDRNGFCDCLTSKYCYLYPYCTQASASGNPCIADPCSFATPDQGATTCSGNGIDTTNCEVARAYTVTETSNINNGAAWCVSKANKDKVKKNDWNQCFFGINSTVSYINNHEFPECVKVTENSKCTEIYLKDSTTQTCQPKPIAANIFVAAEANYCTDGAPSHEPPPPEAGSSIIRIPTVLGLLMLLVFALV